MSRMLYLTLSLAALLAGCGDHEDMCHDRKGGHSYRCYPDSTEAPEEAASCEVGVTFNLSGVQGRLDKQGSVDIRACFDGSCDELTLSVDDEGNRTCKGKPGGPLDQLTSCSTTRSGEVEVRVLRVDGADYGDGQKHVAAFSARHQGERVYSYAEEVQFDATGCGVKTVRLAQSDRSPSP